MKKTILALTALSLIATNALSFEKGSVKDLGDMLFCPNTKWHGIEYEQPRFFNVKNGKYNLDSFTNDDMTSGTTIEVKGDKTYFKRYGNTQLIFGKIEKHGKYIHVQVLKNNTGRHYYSTKSGNIKFKFINDKEKLECEVMH